MFLVGLAVLAVLALGWPSVERTEGYTAKYVGRQQQPDGTYKCPDGYVDTGNNWDMGADQGAKQCRKKVKGNAHGTRRYMHKKLLQAKKACGPRPSEHAGWCDHYKCQKSSGTPSGYAWVCVKGFDRDVAAQVRDPQQGCSTKDTSNDSVTFDGRTCIQHDGGGRQHGFPMCKCCYGAPGGMDGRNPGDPGYRTCPGNGNTECDGC